MLCKSAPKQWRGAFACGARAPCGTHSNRRLPTKLRLNREQRVELAATQPSPSQLGQIDWIRIAKLDELLCRLLFTQWVGRKVDWQQRGACSKSQGATASQQQQPRLCSVARSYSLRGLESASCIFTSQMSESSSRVALSRRRAIAAALPAALPAAACSLSRFASSAFLAASPVYHTECKRGQRVQAWSESAMCGGCKRGQRVQAWSEGASVVRECNVWRVHRLSIDGNALSASGSLCEAYGRGA